MKRDNKPRHPPQGLFLTLSKNLYTGGSFSIRISGIRFTQPNYADLSPARLVGHYPIFPPSLSKFIPCQSLSSRRQYANLSQVCYFSRDTGDYGCHHDKLAPMECTFLVGQPSLSSDLCNGIYWIRSAVDRRAGPAGAISYTQLLLCGQWRCSPASVVVSCWWRYAVQLQQSLAFSLIRGMASLP